MNNIKKFAAFTGLVLVLAFTGCAHMVSGNVTEKGHDDAGYYVTNSCTVVGKSTICTPVTHYDDEDWLIKVAGTNSNGDTDEGWLEVSESDWEGYSIGDNWVAPKE